MGCGTWESGHIVLIFYDVPTFDIVMCCSFITSLPHLWIYEETQETKIIMLFYYPSDYQTQVQEVLKGIMLPRS